MGECCRAEFTINDMFANRNHRHPEDLDVEDDDDDNDKK